MCWKCRVLKHEGLQNREYDKAREALDQISSFNEDVLTWEAVKNFPEELVARCHATYDAMFVEHPKRAIKCWFHIFAYTVLRPSPLEEVLADMASIGVHVRVHPEDVSGGFRSGGIHVGYRVWLLDSQFADVTADTTMYYMKLNGSLKVAEAEVAAYMLSELTDAKLVPYTFRNGCWTFQEWVTESRTAADYEPSPQTPADRAQNVMRWFDYIIQNTDRHGFNYLVIGDDDGLAAIDNGLSFESGSKLWELRELERQKSEYPFWRTPVDLLESAMSEFPTLDSNSVLARHNAAMVVWKRDFAQLSVPF